MDKSHDDRKFPLIMAGNNYDDFTKKYNTINKKLTELEDQYKVKQPGFVISPLWTCYCLHGGIEFNITEQCCDDELKAQMLEIFEDVIGQ